MPNIHSHSHLPTHSLYSRCVPNTSFSWLPVRCTPWTLEAMERTHLSITVKFDAHRGRGPYGMGIVNNYAVSRPSCCHVNFLAKTHLLPEYIFTYIFLDERKKFSAGAHDRFRGFCLSFDIVSGISPVQTFIYLVCLTRIQFISSGMFTEALRQSVLRRTLTVIRG